MKRPNALILCIFSCLLVGCNCRRGNESQAEVTVESGVGVPGLCELGMMMPDIQRCMDDFRLIAWSPQPSFPKSLFGVVPSLGAILYLEEGEPLGLIEFQVVPYKSEVIEGLEIPHPFRGKIIDSVTFTDEGVTKSEVTHYHGRIELHAISYADENTHKGEPFSIIFPDNEEELWYPEQGIKFKTMSDVVVSFSIFPRKSVKKTRTIGETTPAGGVRVNPENKDSAEKVGG